MSLSGPGISIRRARQWSLCTACRIAHPFPGLGSSGVTYINLAPLAVFVHDSHYQLYRTRSYTSCRGFQTRCLILHYKLTVCPLQRHIQSAGVERIRLYTLDTLKGTSRSYMLLICSDVMWNQGIYHVFRQMYVSWMRERVGDGL